MTFRKPQRRRFVRKSVSRDYDDPLYKEFRSKVLARDKHVCQWPKCGSRKRLCVHHIRRWADNHSLRYDTLNGITLCRVCHDRIKDQEIHYVLSFLKIAFENHKKYHDSTPPRRSSKDEDAGRKPKGRPKKRAGSDENSTRDEPKQTD